MIKSQDLLYLCTESVIKSVIKLMINNVMKHQDLLYLCNESMIKSVIKNMMKRQDLLYLNT